MSDADRWSPRLPLPGPEPELEGFDLCQLIASGGTSQVHKAWQKNLHRWVAIKWIQPPLEASEDWVALFRREALATSSLSHPNIVKIFEVGSSAGAIWLALEWVDGVSLAEALCDGPFTTQATLEIMRQIVAALRHAHQRGVVHRDIKPSNILINDEGHVWVADFGIASVRQLGLGDTALMPTLLHAGSALYMAPERLSGHAGTSQPAEDVYALGAVVYEMLSGSPPQGFCEPLATRQPELAAVDAFLASALARDPARRPATVDAFWSGLCEAVQSVAPGSEPASSVPSPSTDSLGKSPRTLWLLLLLGLTFFFFQTVLIGLSPEEQFSFPAGPGHKLYDTAMALTVLNAVFLAAWSVMVRRAWSACRSHPDAPECATVWLCYLPIIIGIVTIVYLAVSD